MKPPATVVAVPSLVIARSGGTAVITWPSAASGFTLETAASIIGSPVSWSTVGTVGQGNLTTSYTVPATPNTQFYRLRK